MKQHRYKNDYIFCVLGPTNTGKTYRAVEKMLSYHDGVIGFPLRLLARENYDRVCAIKGKDYAALVTGEERIIPPNARYFCCTVESMPMQKSFEFVAIDEIQLCADPDRGHVFTHRLLHARGSKETMILGADTMRPILNQIFPDAIFDRAERFSELSYTGFSKLSSLPKRSAVVAFSMDDVYTLAEILRRERGGTAIVLGALSPRARNQQVAMYQKGEVDYLVATDAIGMGLNMDIKHIAFAATQKFDGQLKRTLNAAEIAQIAGRAGRHVENGTFGVTANLKGLNDPLIKAIEHNNLAPVTQLYWRSNNLNYDSPDALNTSLMTPPPSDFFIHGRVSSDHFALRQLMRQHEIKTRIKSDDDVRLLWRVCQTPNFRKNMQEAHLNLLKRMYIDIKDTGYIDESWVHTQVDNLDSVKGEIDALTQRLESIRTWTYISFQGQWLEHSDAWQIKTRHIEDKLSDALHRALTDRFVDKRSAALIQTLESGKKLYASIQNDGKVFIEGHSVGHLQGFRFIPEGSQNKKDQKAIMNATRQALMPELNTRVDDISKSLDRQFSLSDNGYIAWQADETDPRPGEAIVQLVKGEHVMQPKILIPHNDLLSAEQREKITGRIERWVQDHINTVLEPLAKLKDDAEITGAARGIAFQVYESLGLLPRADVEELIEGLDPEGRRSIRQRRIMLGPLLVFIHSLNKPAAVRLRALLWGLYNERELPMPVPYDGAVSIEVDPNAIDRRFYQAISYPVYGKRAIRIDMLDRVINAIYDSAENGKFRAQHKMCEWLGCKIDDLYEILTAMGHRKIEDDAVVEAKPEDPTAAEVPAPVDADKKQETAAESPVKASAEIAETPVETPDAKAEGKATDPVEADAVKSEDKPAAPILPELALFRLKKGKANAKAQRPFNKNKKPNAVGDNKGKKPFKKDGKKDAKKGGKKQQDQGRIYSAGPTKTAQADSPFAILAQLKDNK
jgi:ATP-dependent RNA helicase SUPV3L1/SUV3